MSRTKDIFCVGEAPIGRLSANTPEKMSDGAGERNSLPLRPKKEVSKGETKPLLRNQNIRRVEG